MTTAKFWGEISGNAGTVTNGVYTTSSVTALSDVTKAGSGEIITDAERTKLSGVKTGANVTDADNVLSAGAVMTSGNQTIEGIKTFNAATTLNSTLSVGGNSKLSGNVGIGTTSNSNYSLDIASTGDNKVRILQSSVNNNAQIMFSRLDTEGNNYGPEIIFDKNSSPVHSVDSLNLVATKGDLGMNITWDGKVGIGGTNNTGDNLLVNGTFKATGNAQISSNFSCWW